MRVLAFVVACWLVAFAPLVSRAQDDTSHPIVGVARACVKSQADPQPQCAVLRAPTDFNTVAECNAYMDARLRELGARIHADHPDWDFAAQYACVPDREAYDASAR